MCDDDPKLSPVARSLATTPRTPLYLSVVTVWELTVKEAKGKLKVPRLFERIVEDGMIEFGMQYLPITARDAFYVRELPPLHGDPFDRMMIAQCHVHGLRLITADARLADYGIPVVW